MSPNGHQRCCRKQQEPISLCGHIAKEEYQAGDREDLLVERRDYGEEERIEKEQQRERAQVELFQSAHQPKEQGEHCEVRQQDTQISPEDFCLKDRSQRTATELRT